MKPKMNEKQLKALQCLDELTAYAAENKIPMRIMDELEECKKQISSANVDWNAIQLTMEDLLNSIEQKVSPQTVQRVHSDSEISIDMVKEQVEKMAGRCRADNTSSIDIMARQRNTIVNASCGQLMDISHTEAHMKELKNEGLYLQFFQNCKHKYEKDSFEMLREFLQSIDENYNHMMNHMKSMFQSIGGYKSGVSNEKFYHEYEERRDSIGKNIQGEALTADIGGSDILSLGQTTLTKVKSIVKKLVHKRKFFSWLPIFVLIALFAAGIFGVLAVNQNQENKVEAAADTQSDGSSLDSTIKKVESFLKVFKEEDKETASSLDSPGIGLIFIILVMIAIYTLYISILRKRCDHQIGIQCGEYLKTELLAFEQKNDLSFKLNAAMENAVEEYERQYINVLNNLFQNSQYHAENTTPADNLSGFDALRTEWNHVRNM